MKLPKKVKIGAHEYTVAFPYVFTERYELNGQCDYYDCELRIRDTDSGGVKIQDSMIYTVFLHELIHAIEHTFCGERGIAEETVCGLAHGLASVIHDNPGIFSDCK